MNRLDSLNIREYLALKVVDFDRNTKDLELVNHAKQAATLAYNSSHHKVTKSPKILLLVALEPLV